MGTTVTMRRRPARLSTTAASIFEIVGCTWKEARIKGDRERVRLPDGSTVECEVEPDVDLADEDVRDSHGFRVGDTYAARVVVRVHR